MLKKNISTILPVGYSLAAHLYCIEFFLLVYAELKEKLILYLIYLKHFNQKQMKSCNIKLSLVDDNFGKLRGEVSIYTI